MLPEEPRPFDQTLTHFRDHGWMRVPGAFGAREAAAMQAAIWSTLARSGILRDRPSTWTAERPIHLQSLKHDPVFRWVASPALLAAIAQVLGTANFAEPANWGALFAAFPVEREWRLPDSGWHADAHYLSALWPPRGVKTFALVDDVVSLGGGTLLVSGSHRLIHRWLRDNPPPPGARSADMRRILKAHHYIRDLHGPGDAEARIGRFMDRVERWDDIELFVFEQTGAAGDVLLVHPLLLHVASPNCAAAPRFMLSGGVTLDNWGWG
jgi:hypothetical protein